MALYARVSATASRCCWKSSVMQSPFCTGWGTCAVALLAFGLLAAALRLRRGGGPAHSHCSHSPLLLDIADFRLLGDRAVYLTFRLACGRLTRFFCPCFSAGLVLVQASRQSGTMYDAPRPGVLSHEWLHRTCCRRLGLIVSVGSSNTVMMGR